MAYKIGYELASVGTVIVSGMALGIDSVAAAGALAAGGRTVAVLGCGIDVVYPSEHATLMEEIVKNGAVITEYPPATRPEGRNFPVRNRIISGLGQGTVIVEADQRSGALITAKTAILQGRDIYAIPGNVGDENTSGTNQLIRDGAAVVLRARDILENYTFLYRDTVRMGLLAEAESSSEPNDAVFERLRVYARTVGEGRSSPRTTAKESGSVSRSATRPTPRPKSTANAHSDPSRLSGHVSGDRQDIPVRPAAPFAGDRSGEALRSLSETQRNIFAALPLDRAVTVDYLTREGFSMSDIMAAMTILEIKGLVVTLPGGLYSRK